MKFQIDIFNRTLTILPESKADRSAILDFADGKVSLTMIGNGEVIATVKVPEAAQGSDLTNQIRDSAAAVEGSPCNSAFKRGWDHAMSYAKNAVPAAGSDASHAYQKGWHDHIDYLRKLGELLKDETDSDIDQ